jgi:ribose transport system substrate-binding protein
MVVRSGLLRIPQLLLLGLLISATGCTDSGSQSSDSGTQDSLGDATSADAMDAGDGPVRVAFVTNQIADFWKIAEAGALDAGKEFNAQVDVVMPPEATAVVQKDKVEDLMTAGVQAIAISPLDAENQVEWLNSLAGKLPLITHDSDAPESDRLMYIGMDNYAAGRMCGELTIKAVPDGGQVLLCIGRLEQDNSKYRRQGVIDVLLGRDRDARYYKEQPDAWDSNDAEIKGEKYTIVTTVTDQGKPEVALAKAEDAINTYPELKAMVGLFEYNPPACYQAVKTADKLGDIALVGFDENDVTLQAIKDGDCIGTVVQNPYMYGYESVRVLTSLLAGDDSVIPESKYIDIAPRAITAENVDEFWEDLRAKKGL